MTLRPAIRAAMVIVWLASTGAAAERGSEIAQALQEAVRSYDLTGATVALAKARDAAAASPTSELETLHVRASLAVAELVRIQWERVPPSETSRRRELGGRIDAVAREGLEVIEGLPESSERERLRADLVATMIRSDYRARKYEEEFKGAVARAIELDEGNAMARVSAAKPYLFASPEHGGDLEEARRLLTQALELDPDLESARLLRALASERRGDLESARADLQLALENNPDCSPARDALDRIGRGNAP